jgi:hypothetical protein
LRYDDFTVNTEKYAVILSDSMHLLSLLHAQEGSKKKEQQFNTCMHIIYHFLPFLRQKSRRQKE